MNGICMDSVYSRSSESSTWNWSLPRQRSSLQAEATIILSASVFIVVTQQYEHERKQQLKIQYESDNLKLIRRSKNIKNMMNHIQIQLSKQDAMSQNKSA